MNEVQKNMDTLLAAVVAKEGTVDSVVALLQGVANELDHAKTDASKVASIADRLRASAGEFAAAVNKRTEGTEPVKDASKPNDPVVHPKDSKTK